MCGLMQCRKTMRTWPAYVHLLESGELRKRAADAVASMSKCRACPRNCGVNRLQDERGFCRAGRLARVASYFPHHGEEDCLRGRRGSGTIFLSGCNLRCVFCQNFDISQQDSGSQVQAADLAAMMIDLQKSGAHNINWVSPSHFVPQLLEGLALAAEQGLRLPIVYNSGGYDSLTALQWLHGAVDIYMPDFKYWEPDVAEKLSGARDYPDVARVAIMEMHRQVGDLQLDNRGLARRGLLVRHLVLPGGLAGTAQIAAWVAREVSKETYINLMDQYHPDGLLLEAASGAYPGALRRRLEPDEYLEAKRVARHAGLSRFDERN